MNRGGRKNARGGRVVLARLEGLRQVFGVGGGGGQEAAGFGIDKGGGDEIARRHGAHQPFALAGRAVQRQQRRRHLEVVGEIGTGGIALGVTEAAARQAALAQRPVGRGDRQAERLLVSGCVVCS